MTKSRVYSGCNSEPFTGAEEYQDESFLISTDLISSSISKSNEPTKHQKLNCFTIIKLLYAFVFMVILTKNLL